jgi:hypothetical protein
MKTPSPEPPERAAILPADVESPAFNAESDWVMYCFAPLCRRSIPAEPQLQFGAKPPVRHQEKYDSAVRPTHPARSIELLTGVICGCPRRRAY